MPVHFHIRVTGVGPQVDEGSIFLSSISIPPFPSSQVSLSSHTSLPSLLSCASFFSAPDWAFCPQCGNFAVGETDAPSDLIEDPEVRLLGGLLVVKLPVHPPCLPPPPPVTNSSFQMTSLSASRFWKVLVPVLDAGGSLECL